MNRPLPSESAVARGAAGRIEILVDAPAEARGIALACHPHPLYGGANSNKVVHTLARVFRDLGYVALRPNFRGVGASEGAHDHGAGESEDMLAVLDWARARWGDLPRVLGGFSFGAHVQARLAVRLAANGAPPRHLVLVGMAAGMVDTVGARQYETPAIPKGIPALIIHGEVDDTVPLANVLDWARPQALPVVVLPGADHFFHGRLGSIRDIVARNVDPARPALENNGCARHPGRV
ncbi:MAG: alpha/beta hydrolase [Azoarcus sp.]|jgi:alpha/beta superfamily hydrolase|nr:alpha/beta hydrolase [Azoarcus sp.]